MIKNWYTSLPLSFSTSLLLGLATILLLISQEYVSYALGNYGYAFSWVPVSARTTISIGLLLMLTPIINYFLDLFYRQKWSPKIIIISTLSSILIASIHQLLGGLLYNIFYQLYSDQQIESLSSLWIIRTGMAGIITSLIYYWVIYIGYWAMKNYQKIITQEKELTDARLAALKSQLQPHFLFNTLNSISSLMDFDVPASQQMINQLAHLLRAVLKKENQAFITLGEELDFIRTYLSIEEIRFDDRLKVIYDIAPKTKEILVPTLILQPLVENAIKHGISKLEEGGIIEISSDLIEINNQTYLWIKVSDSGPGVAQNGSSNSGIGLKNVSRRLTELYAANHYLYINGDSGFEVEMKLPLKI